MPVNFSKLEKDEKSFRYAIRILKYILNDNKKGLLKLENEIQQEEIFKHLELNKISEEDKNVESIRWIKEHGNKFRIYLNSLKIIVLIFLNGQINCYKECERNKLTFNKYCDIVDLLNKYREILEDIF